MLSYIKSHKRITIIALGGIIVIAGIIIGVACCISEPTNKKSKAEISSSQVYKNTSSKPKKASDNDKAKNASDSQKSTESNSEESSKAAEGADEITETSSKQSSTASASNNKSHTHNFVKGQAVNATCTTGGYTVYKCACGAIENRNATGALGHSFGAWTTTVAATATTAGTKVRTCTRCGASESQSIPATGGNISGPTVENSVVGSLGSICNTVTLSIGGTMFGIEDYRSSGTLSYKAQPNGLMIYFSDQKMGNQSYFLELPNDGKHYFLICFILHPDSSYSINRSIMS